MQVTEAPSPSAQQLSDGRIRWELDLGEGSDATLTFSYLIKHPRNSALRER